MPRFDITMEWKQTYVLAAYLSSIEAETEEQAKAFAQRLASDHRFQTDVRKSKPIMMFYDTPVPRVVSVTPTSDQPENHNPALSHAEQILAGMPPSDVVVGPIR